MKKKQGKQKIKDWFSSFAQKARRLLTKRNQRILLLFTLVLVAAAIFDAINDFLPEPIAITLYVLATAGFIITCTLWIRAIVNFAALAMLPVIRQNPIADALITNNHLRTVLTAVPGTGINLIYTVFNGVVGITVSSAWYGSLSAYYLLLCIMRFLSVSYAKRIYTKTERSDGLAQRECRVYRNCGVMLSISSIALGGAVIMLVSGDGGMSYPGLMIYAVATYTFYKLTISIVNMVKERKEKSLLLKTLRSISYSDSLVSLLALQTALFAAFGQDAGELVPTMNALTGAAVCLMILGLGICMVHDANKPRSIAPTEKEIKE